MKRILAALIVLTVFLTLAIVPVQAEEGEIVQDQEFICERLRNGSLKLTGYKGDATNKSIAIPAEINGSHIERIGSFAFDGCKMTNVTIPSTVRVIEAFAFNDCREIQMITIPNETYFIDGNPFTGCINLVNINVSPYHPTLEVLYNDGGSLYSKRNKMLLCYPCSNTDTAYTVKEGTVCIGKDAFLHCDQLVSITLPDTVTEIGDGAFEGCTKLASIVLPESLLTIGARAFAGCTLLDNISIPKQVSRIETSTFQNCQSLTKVIIPDGVTVICDRAFLGCSLLPEIRLPETVSKICDQAFYGCASLANAYIPVSVTEIGNNAFDEVSPRFLIHTVQYAFVEIYANLNNKTFTLDRDPTWLTE